MNDPPIDARILGEAADWLMHMQEAPLDAERQAEFERWHASSGNHARAWKRAERLLARMGSLPPGLARPVLSRPDRRAALHTLAVLSVAVPLGWFTWRHLGWRGGLSANYVTAIGERLDIRLHDGTRVTLNTDTVLDSDIDGTRRLLHLRRGEIYVDTAPDPRIPARPFLVHTVYGKLRALGTRFRVTHDGLLAVYEGAVEIRPAAVGSDSVVVPAGARVRFNRTHVSAAGSAREAELAWREGLLVADEMPLAQWAAELARHGGKPIEYQHALRALPVSGTYPLDDWSLALHMLARAHGLRIRDEGQAVMIGR